VSNPYVGEIRLFAGNFAPSGWEVCQGQTLAIADNEALFQLIGTTYGGDGQTTFNLPDLRSRVPVHVGSGYVLGQDGGVETVTLTASQIPAHTHAAQATANSAASPDPGGNVWATASDTPYSTSTPSAAMSAEAIGSAGGGQPHDNMLPFVAVNFIISLYGTYPSAT
jgi:microcystin-dependent protein